MRILIITIADILRVLHNRIHEIVKALSATYEVTVWSLNAWYLGNDTRFVEIPYNIKVKYFTEKHVHPILQEVYQTRLLIDPKIDGEKLDEYDLIINYNTLYMPIIIKLVANKIPIVFDIADDLPMLFASSSQVPPMTRYLIGKISTTLLTLNARLSDAITVITPELALKYELPRSKTSIIPNGVNVEFFMTQCNESARNEILKKFDIGENTIIIGYVGAIEHWIDFVPVLLALRALSKSVDIKLMIIGKGSGLKTLTNLVKSLNLEKHVIFVGTVNYENVPKYVSAFDIGIAPFKKNELTDTIMPLKVLEYLACGKPVIVTPLQSVVNALNGNVIYATTHQDYLEAIKMLYDENVRKYYGEKGRSIVFQYYDWRIITKKFIQLCEKLIK